MERHETGCQMWSGVAIARLNFWSFQAAGLALSQEVDMDDRRDAEAREEVKWASRRGDAAH